MRITVNGEARDVPEGLTLTALVESLGIDPRFVAVEQNLKVVKRALHATTTLAEGDTLEVVHFVGGG